MVLHGVTMETRYITKNQNSNYMYIDGNILIIVTEIPAVDGESQKGA